MSRSKVTLVGEAFEALKADWRTKLGAYLNEQRKRLGMRRYLHQKRRLVRAWLAKHHPEALRRPS